MIESYFKGELSPHIKDKIHDKIANDPKLKAKFISFALLLRSIYNVGYKIELETKIKNDPWLSYYYHYGRIGLNQIYHNN